MILYISYAQSVNIIKQYVIIILQCITLTLIKLFNNKIVEYFSLDNSTFKEYIK